MPWDGYQIIAPEFGNEVALTPSVVEIISSLEPPAAHEYTKRILSGALAAPKSLLKFSQKIG